MEHPSEIDHGFDFSLVAMRAVKWFFLRGLDRMFTAIAYAKVGNLDVVKAVKEEMLEQDKAQKKP